MNEPFHPTTLKGQVNLNIRSGDRRPRSERYDPRRRGYQLAMGSDAQYRERFSEIDWRDGAP